MPVPLSRKSNYMVKSQLAYQASSLSWNKPIQQVGLKNFTYSNKKLQNIFNLPIKQVNTLTEPTYLPGQFVCQTNPTPDLARVI